MDVCFWPWDFQGISHNFVEYPEVELWFVWNFQGESKKMKNSWGVFTKVHPPPSPFDFFSGITDSKVCLHHGEADK